MINLKLKLKLTNIDKARYTEAFNKAIEVQMRQAARAFLRAAIPNVPVSSGMARATFIPLGRFLRVAIPIDPIRKPTPSRNPGLGASLGTTPDEAFIHKGNNFRFQISLKVYHYWLNEFFSQNYMNPQIEPPWKSLSIGARAFYNYWEDFGKHRLPNPVNFLIIKEIKK